jgi:BNR repeat-like domain
MGRALSPVLRFESQPRPALGLARTHDPKLVLRATRALTVLAVADGDAKPVSPTGAHGHGGGGTGRLLAFTSQDGGDSFGPPVQVSAPDATVRGQGENAPSLALVRRGLCAVWEQERPDGKGTDLMFSSSAMGTSWMPPTRITDKPTPSSNSYSSLIAAANGELWAVWLDGRERSEGTLDVYAARSTDGGKTFGKNLLVARGACPCCRPMAAVTSDGAVHVAWRGVSNKDVRDILIATSRDSGQSFGPARSVWADNWVVSGCPHTGPALAAVGNSLHLAWYSESTGGASMGVRWTRSLDAGKSFAKPVILSQRTADANHPSLSVSPTGRVHLVFQARLDSGDSWGAFRAYVVEVTSPETLKRGAQLVPGKYAGISYPVALFDTAGRLWVAWTGGGSVQLSRARES